MARRAGRLVVAACLLGSLLANGIPAVASLRGEQLLVVLSGSMVPLFHAGDAVAVSHPPESGLREGMVVSFHAPGSDRLTTHRIHRLVERREGLFVQTKGDANPAPDPDFTPAGNVVGVMGASVPHLGYALSAGQSPAGKLVLLGVPLVALLLAQVGTLRRLRVGAAEGGVPWTRVASVAFMVVLAGGGGIVAARATSSLLTDVEPASANTFSTRTFCTSTTTYRARILQDTPSLYYRLGETSGTTAADSSNQARNGTYQGVPTLGAEGAIKCDANGAVDLDGTNDWISSATRIAPPGNFSQEAWFRTTTGGGQLIGFGNAATGLSTANDRQLYLTTGGQLVFSVDPTSTAPKAITSGATTYLDGAWHHVVATYASTNGVQRLYVDGSQVSTATGATGLATTMGYWRVGYDQLSGAGGTPPSRLFLTGRLDEVAVYPSTLSAATVSAHYAANGA